jgi:hypothetical protein
LLGDRLGEDPLSAHLEGRVDSWKDQSIRHALAPLAALAEERALAVLVVAHLNKGQSTDPIQRLGGSIGLPAAARSVLLLGRDPEDPQGERGNRRVLAQVKNNFGPQANSLRLEIIESEVPDPLSTRRAAHIMATGTSEYEGSDLLAPPTPNDLPVVTGEAVDFLRETLAGGARTAKEVEVEASQAGIPFETVKRAKKRAGVITRKQRGVLNGAWIWELAGASSAVEQPAGWPPFLARRAKVCCVPGSRCWAIGTQTSRGCPHRQPTRSLTKERRWTKMSVIDAAGSYLKLNKLAAGGYSWNIQVAVLGDTVEDLREAKKRILQLNEDFARDLIPEPEEPEF